MDRRLQIKLWLKNILEFNLSDISYSAFIFGSQANSVILKRSDIDIGIISNSAIPLGKMVSIYNAVQQLPILYKIDIVDFNTADEPFKSVALSNVEYL